MSGLPHVWGEETNNVKGGPARICERCGERWYFSGIEGVNPHPEPMGCEPLSVSEKRRLWLIERDLKRTNDAIMQNFGVDMEVREGETPDAEKIHLRVALERERRFTRESQQELDALLIALKDVPGLPEEVLEICQGYWGDPLW